LKKYLVLYQSDLALSGPSVSEMLAMASPEQMKAGMAAWQRWHEKIGSAVVDLGTPLDKSTNVTSGGSTPGKSRITGYTVLQAGSIEEAVALMSGHPHFHMPGASVEVLECVPMPGM
jgi:hypothetical protein